MKYLKYYIVDVFTEHPFGGNPLAVCTDASGVDDEVMQNIARELNLSETTFVLPARDSRTDFRVRVFTPVTELPAAGHTSIGTTYVLAHEERVQGSMDERRVVLEQEDGPVSVLMHSAAMLTMQQPLPTFGEKFEERNAVAAMLSLAQSDLVPELPLQAISCGVPFLCVPLRTLEAAQRIQFRQDIWQRTLRHWHAPQVVAYTTETVRRRAHIHSRVFSPGLGIPEDPATGGAAGAVGAHLFRYARPVCEAQPTLVIEQGIEIRRPSALHVMLESSGSEITRLRVGGRCIVMGEGRIACDVLPESSSRIPLPKRQTF